MGPISSWYQVIKRHNSAVKAYLRECHETDEAVSLSHDQYRLLGHDTRPELPQHFERRGIALSSSCRESKQLV